LAGRKVWKDWDGGSILLPVINGFLQLHVDCVSYHSGCGSLPWDPPSGYPNHYGSNNSINRITVVTNNRNSTGIVTSGFHKSCAQDINKDCSVSKTTWTSADTSSRRDLQGPNVAWERARTALYDKCE
jgi:hypothetical protein